MGAGFDQAGRIYIQPVDGGGGKQIGQDSARPASDFEDTASPIQSGLFKEVFPQVARPTRLLKKSVMPVHSSSK
jgi:hypothetical protein